MSVVLFRKILWILIAATLALLVYLSIPGTSIKDNSPAPGNAETVGPAPGGPFSMIAHTGETVTEKTYAGKGWLMFVGFTNCPDICPTTLAEMSSWFDALGAEADGLTGFLVTVDPERDTVDVLRQYISSFDDRIVALRPSPSELANFAKAYRIYYAKVPTQEGDYTMDHTAGVLLFDRDGKFSGTIDREEPKEVALQKIRRLLDRR
ncbi:SCO1/SenC superfamily [Mesorhizobium metallidurans STM 2683]|uniref:SCO1/SenC superfamily n=1 Tax=Mesorhizobium metallidurans STM 2683 TaxID=1297569 RepID=M5EWT2_9HYPH|nr:SCO family protein [Mesorhizobium metallidurans]CCV08383.1 SCO1/SenC superfamily [Mesorhizobium metallidurans STM 2683]